jgi:hypothetical protein
VCSSDLYEEFYSVCSSSEDDEDDEAGWPQRRMSTGDLTNSDLGGSEADGRAFGYGMQQIKEQSKQKQQQQQLGQKKQQQQQKQQQQKQLGQQKQKQQQGASAGVKYQRLKDDILTFVNESSSNEKNPYESFDGDEDGRRKGGSNGAGPACLCNFWDAVVRAFGGGGGGGSVWKFGKAPSSEKALSDFSFDDEEEENITSLRSKSVASDEEKEEEKTPEYIQKQVDEVRKEREKIKKKRSWMKKLLPKPFRRAIVDDPFKSRGQGKIRGKPNFLYNLSSRELRAQLQVAKPVNASDPIPQEVRLWKDDAPRWY